MLIFPGAVYKVKIIYKTIWAILFIAGKNGNIEWLTIKCMSVFFQSIT